MSDVQRYVRKRRQVRIGNMDQRVIVAPRAIKSTIPGQTNFTEGYSSENEEWAAVNTLAPDEIFDGVNMVKTPTHEFFIRWRPGVTEKFSVLYDGNTYEIDSVENLDERNQFYRLRCNKRGPSDIVVNQA